MTTALQNAPSYTTQDTLPRTLGLYLLFIDEQQWNKALDFYSNTLGWELLDPEGAAHGWAEFKTGGIRLALHRGAYGATVKPVDTNLDFFVKSVTRTRQTLQIKGIKVGAEPAIVCEGSDTWISSFTDPFGNRFGFCGAK